MDVFNIALLGFGNIGSGLAEVIERNRSRIDEALGDEICIKYVLDLRDLSDTPYAACAVHDFEIILNDPSVVLVCEMMGGLHPAFDYSMAALKAGKSVVTSNKEVVAAEGTALLRTAKDHGVFYLYEAAVGGAVPVLHAIRLFLAGTDIRRIDGILNGTTNYILTRMNDCAVTFDEALAEAKKQGYAEVNPRADISGLDTCRKLCILIGATWGQSLQPASVYYEGIDHMTSEDSDFAKRCGGVLKLAATAWHQNDGSFVAAVSPCVVLNENPLQMVADVFNAVRIQAKDTGDLMFYGQGAGRYPTAGALVSDILDVAGRRGVQRSWQTFAGKLIPYEDALWDWCLEIGDLKSLAALGLEKAVILNRAEGRYDLFVPQISQKELAVRLRSCSVLRQIRASN